MNRYQTVRILLHRVITVGAVFSVIFALASTTLTDHLRDKDWSHLWLAGRMIVTGHVAELYSPKRQIEVYQESNPQGDPPPAWEKRNDILGCFNYPPPAALWYAGFAWLSLEHGGMLHNILSVLLALVVCGQLVQLSGHRIRYAVAVLAVLAHPAFFYNFALGQNSVMTMTLIIGGWYLACRGRDFVGGLVWGVLIFKFTWLLSIGWIPIWLKRWRMLGGLVIGSVLTVGVTMIVLGPTVFGDYLHLFKKVSQLDALPGYVLNMKYGALGVSRKWFGVGTTANVLGGLSCAIVLAVTWIVLRRGNRASVSASREVMGCCLMVALWINPHLNYYDMLLASVVVLLMISRWSELHFWEKVIVTCVSVLNYMSLPIDVWIGHSHVLPFPGLILLANWLLFAYWLGGERLTHNITSDTACATSRPQTR